MKLVASMPTYNELGRYLPMVVSSLLEFVDEVRVLDDGSTDGTFDYLAEREGVTVKRNAGESWREHEAVFRSALLDFTLEAEPTHVLAIDADELIPDGAVVLEALEAHPRRVAFTLRMVELWSLSPPMVRHDGGWHPRSVPILYRVPHRPADRRIQGRAMASGRVPHVVRTQRSRTVDTGADVLHLGWSDPAEREARHARYVELDGGKYHARAHLDSIMWPDEKCDLRPYHDPLAMRDADYPLA